MTATNDTLSGNTADHQGGGIYNIQNLNLNTCSFSANSAPSGGAIDNDLAGVLTASNDTFSGNTAVQQGGAICNTANVTTSNCTFSANSAPWGGAISNQYSLSAINDTFSGNAAVLQGGGIDNSDSMLVSNCTFFGNRATGQSGQGGGIYNAGNQSWTVSNCTLSGNSAADGGGGIYSVIIGILQNTIVAGNTAATGHGDLDGGARSMWIPPTLTAI